MAKKSLLRTLTPIAVIAGAVFLASRSRATSDTLGGGASPYLLPSLQGETFIAPTGEAYTPSRDPIKSLRYAPAVTTSAYALQSISQEKGRELRAKEILPVVQNLSPQQQKTAILLSSPQTLASYSRVVRGTTKVRPAARDSSGMTATDRRVRSSSRYKGSKYTSGGI